MPMLRACSVRHVNACSVHSNLTGRPRPGQLKDMSANLACVDVVRSMPMLAGAPEWN